MQRIPNLEDMKRLLEEPDASGNIGMRDRAMIEVAYSTACRASELWNLKLDDLELTGGLASIRQGKGRKDRVAPLGRHAVKWLVLYLEKARPALLRDRDDSERWLWLSRAGGKLSLIAVQYVFKRYSFDAGLSHGISIHGVRRLAATSMLENGAHPLMIGEMLGHATLKTLGSYLRVSMKDLKAMQAKAEEAR